jgi:MraZ protein
VTRGLDGCLFVYPMADWERLAERIAALPMTQAGARQFQRLMFSGATDCQLDGQGRISLPGFLRQYAGIERDAVVIGVNTRIEIWSAGRWAEQRAKVEQEGEFIAEQLSNLGI